MQGDLRTTSLEQLCRTLDERASSGELTLTQGPQTVQIWFRQGRVVRAQSSAHQMRLGDRLVHGGLILPDELAKALSQQRVSGIPLGEVLVQERLVNHHVVRVFTQEQLLDSLFACIRWTSGNYTFVNDEVEEPNVPTDLTVDQLFFALESRHRRWDEITRTIPDLNAIPEFVPGADPESTVLESSEGAIARAIDGRMSLEELADELGFGPYEVALTVHGLAVLGLVRLTDPSNPADPAPAAPAPAAPAPEPVAAAPSSAASDALAEATAFLLGDDEPPAAPQPAAAKSDLEDAAATLAELADTASPPPAPAPVAPAPVAAPAPEPAPPPRPAPEPAAAATTTPPRVASVDTDHALGGDGDDDMRILIADMSDLDDSPAPIYVASSDESDEDIAPWAFTIEGDGGPAAAPAPKKPEPRRRSTPPITSSATVGDAATGTPLPEPAPAPAPEPEPAAPAAPAAPAESPSRPRTGEMSDLLRELRQLSGE